MVQLDFYIWFNNLSNNKNIKKLVSMFVKIFTNVKNFILIFWIIVIFLFSNINEFEFSSHFLKVLSNITLIKNIEKSRY